MTLWESEDLCNSISICRKANRLFEPSDLDSLIPVKPDEIKKEILKYSTGIHKILNGQNILPEEFKPLIAQKMEEVKKNG